MDEMDDDTRTRTAEIRLGGMLDWNKTFSVSDLRWSHRLIAVLTLFSCLSSGLADLGCRSADQSSVEKEGER